MTKAIDNVKLGIFVTSGIILLVLILYMIGKNQSLFTSTFTLKVRFRNVDGLTSGNNVRFSGIQSGTVKEIDIINDTTIEVSMLIEKSVRKNIHKNSVVYIGSEGLMGNKVVNIIPNNASAPVVDEGDIIQARTQGNLNNALSTLYQTNDNVALVSGELLKTMNNINSSPLLKAFLNDTLLLSELHTSLRNIMISSKHISNSSVLVEDAMMELKDGRGVLGLLLTNKSAELETVETLTNINVASYRIKKLIAKIDSVASVLEMSINNKDGLAYTLLQDTAFAGQVSRSLNSVEAGTAAFNESMDALKHNFLIRGYFKKQEKRRGKTIKTDK